MAAVGVLALTMLACNIGVNVPIPPSQPAQQVDLNEALTLAVPTIQAATQQAASGIPTNTVPPPATPPMVTVSSDTNCRTGPSIYYAFVTLFQTGMQAKVVGKYTPANYWIIEIPSGGGSTCWLWGQYATVIGDTAGLPEGVPPPLPPRPHPRRPRPIRPKR